VSRSARVATSTRGTGDLELGGHVAVEPHGDGEFAERLDGLVHCDASPLDLHPALREERGDVRLADGAEQTPLVGSLAGLGEVQRPDGPGLSCALAVSFAAAASWRTLICSRFFFKLAVVHAAQLVRQEVVARVPVGDVANLRRGARARAHRP